MTSILLVHGGMHGAWCWRRVRRILAGAGHDVIAPTLTGLGHRSHLNHRDIGLHDHVADVLQCVEAEELDDFVLVGHSYGGMVVTGVADRVGERVSSLIYLDAIVPESGQSASDIVGRRVDYSQLADGMLPLLASFDFGVTDPDDLAWVQRRITPQSVKTVTDSLVIRSDLNRLKRAYVACHGATKGGPVLEGLVDVAARLERDPNWTFRRLDTGHDCMVTAPEEVARLILELSGTPVEA